MMLTIFPQDNTSIDVEDNPEATIKATESHQISSKAKKQPADKTPPSSASGILSSLNRLQGLVEHLDKKINGQKLWIHKLNEQRSDLEMRMYRLEQFLVKNEGLHLNCLQCSRLLETNKGNLCSDCGKFVCISCESVHNTIHKTTREGFVEIPPES